MPDDPIRLDMSIEQATEVWLSRYASANTRAAYGSDLRSYLSWYGDGMDALGARPEELTLYRAERMAAGTSPATVDRQFAALRAFYDAACELGMCADNPFGVRSQAITNPSRTRSLTPDEVNLLRRASASDARTALLVRLLLDEGLRLAEVLALDHTDVSGSRSGKRLRILRHGTARHVTLDRSASRSLGELEQSAPKPGPLFTGPGRGRAGSPRLTRSGADHLIKHAAAAAGIAWSVSANVLRRTHVTNAERVGVPIDQIRRAMGHRDVRSTRRYLADEHPQTTP